MMETSSVLPRKSTAIFGNLLKMAKTPSSVCLYNKENITLSLEDMNLMFSWKELYLTSELSERVRYRAGYYMPAHGYEFYLRVEHEIEDKFHIHNRASNILFII